MFMFNHLYVSGHEMFHVVLLGQFFFVNSIYSLFTLAVSSYLLLWTISLSLWGYVRMHYVRQARVVVFKKNGEYSCMMYWNKINENTTQAMENLFFAKWAAVKSKHARLFLLLAPYSVSPFACMCVFHPCAESNSVSLSVFHPTQTVETHTHTHNATQ